MYLNTSKLKVHKYRQRTWIALFGIAFVLAVVSYGTPRNEQQQPSRKRREEKDDFQKLNKNELNELNKIESASSSSASSLLLLEKINNNKNAEEEPIHITHIFTTFTTQNADAIYEMKTVQESWKLAAEYAKAHELKLNVEFLDFAFEEDRATVPFFAKFIPLNYSLHDVMKGNIPTCGEPYEKVLKHGRGKVLVSTNADIGLMEDFYIRIWKWSNADYSSPPAQVHAIKKAAQFYHQCRLFQPSSGSTSVEWHLQLCAEDVKVVFENHGGLPALWGDHASFQIAALTVQLMMKEEKDGETPVTFKNAMAVINSLAGKTGESSLPLPFTVDDWKIKFKKFTPTALEAVSDHKKPKYFAGTITRMDVDIKKLNTVYEETPVVKDAKYFQQMTKSKQFAKQHPGNDVFVINSLHNVPPILQRMAQPQGVRPFGNWIANVFSLSEKIPWRRISSSAEDAWTFHIGIGLWGGSAIPWMERASKNPDFTLFLTSNWNRVSGGLIEKQIEKQPAICRRSVEAWRSKEFCEKFDASFCFGMIRFGCSQYLQLGLRDVIWYRTTCHNLGSEDEAKELQEPMCSFCNYLFKRERLGKVNKKNTKDFICNAREPSKFCKNLHSC